MKLLKVIAVATLLPLAATQAARAADPEINVDVQSLIELACKDDIKKFCEGAEKGKANACLKRNDSALSDQCKMARMTLDFMRKVSK